MSGDLEDFLRRAAQRRQAKAATPPPQTSRPAARQKPEYSNSRTERLPRPVDDDIVVAEVVEDTTSQWQNRRRQVEQAKQAAKQEESLVAKQVAASKRSVPSLMRQVSQPAAAPPVLTGHTVEDLIRMLRQPGGMQQAVLLKEILERPEHQW